MRKKGKKRKGERGGRKQKKKAGREGEKLVGGEILWPIMGEARGGHQNGIKPIKIS